MANEFSKFNGYDVKDAKARGDLSSLQAQFATLNASMTALAQRVAALESGNVLGVGTNISGRKIRITLANMQGNTSSGSNFTVFKVSDSNYIDFCPGDGYYQGYGAFDNIYDTGDVAPFDYSGGGTISVLDNRYVSVDYV